MQRCGGSNGGGIPVMVRSGRWSPVLIVCIFLSFTAVSAIFFGGASAREPGKRLVGTFGDWSVHVAGKGASKTCYAISQPRKRLPVGLNRDPGFLFVTMRPATRTRDEISWALGFPAKRGAGASLTVGTFKAAVGIRGSNAWIKYLAQQADAIAAMKKGATLVLRTRSQRGNNLMDEYSLRGFTKALDLARKRCS